MKLSLSLILIAMMTVSCEGPTGPQGLTGIQGEQGVEGIQGIQGERGVSRIMFDNKVSFPDYYRSELLTDPNGTGLGAWMAGIKHDSIKTTSEITIYDVILDEDSVQIWISVFYAGEVIDGKLGLFDPDVNIFLGLQLRIIVTN